MRGDPGSRLVVIPDGGLAAARGARGMAAAIEEHLRWARAAH
jgi:hypothetical protein